MDVYEISELNVEETLTHTTSMRNTMFCPAFIAPMQMSEDEEDFDEDMLE